MISLTKSSLSDRKRTRLAVASLIPVLALAACSGQGSSMTSPSALNGSTLAKPAALADTGTTTVSFTGYDESTLSVDVNTLTTATLGQPYIDQGKIHLSIWVDASGVPVPFTGGAGSWVRVDQNGGGLPVLGATTSTHVDLDSLATTFAGSITADAECGDTVTFRAQYVTGGGSTKVDTHMSAPTNFTLSCAGCVATFGQGYWKNHASAWPVTSLALGARTYTQAELLSVMSDLSPNSNGLIQLAIQLIAATLNVANGASTSIDGTIAAADALIGSLVVPPVGSDHLASSVTNSLKDALEAYNDSCRVDD